MKKSLLFIFLLVLPLVSAIDINLKQNYSPGETLVFSIAGNFLSPISLEDIYFYSDREQMPLISDMGRIQDKYYVYALLPLTERNYTFVIKNAHYFENGVEKTEDIERNFSVSGDVIDYSVSPGFVIAKSDFSISVESKNKPLSLSAKFLDQTQTANVPIGQKKKISFSISKVKTFSVADISLSALGTSYTIPVAIIPAANASQYTSNYTETERFRFSKSTYNFSVNKNKEKRFAIYLENLGNEVKNIRIDFSDDLSSILSVTPLEIDSIKEYDSNKIELAIETSSKGRYRGEITASSENYSAKCFLTINSFDEDITLPVQNTTPEPEKCAFLDGVVCSSGESCDGKIVDASDGECCIGLCQEKKSYTGTIIGILLVVAVAAGLFFLYKRLKKAKKSPEDILAKKQSDFESRMSGEVKGSLSKS